MCYRGYDTMRWLTNYIQVWVATTLGNNLALIYKIEYVNTFKQVTPRLTRIVALTYMHPKTCIRICNPTVWMEITIKNIMGKGWYIVNQKNSIGL